MFSRCSVSNIHNKKLHIVLKLELRNQELQPWKVADQALHLVCFHGLPPKSLALLCVWCVVITEGCCFKTTATVTALSSAAAAIAAIDA